MTSDIHGNASLLKRLLKEAEFSGEDMLFILGDLIEKGPESLAALRYVSELSGMENVQVLIGNVDLWRLQLLEGLNEENCQSFYDFLSQMRWWESNIFDEMAGELRISLDSPQKALSCKELLLESFRTELDFIRSLPAVVETSNYIFVHGGLPCRNLEEVKNKEIYEVLKFDGFADSGLSFQKYVVAGHWPVAIYNDNICQTNPLINRSQHIISIDGGCGLHEYGQLNLLIIPEIDCEIDRITHIACDGLERFEAVTSQEASAASVNIHYGNRRVRILEEGDEFTCVEHSASGRRLRVPTSHIYGRDGEWASAGYTDYLLPVKTGDTLALVEQTSEGYFVKKGGVCGWYLGELRKKKSVLTVQRANGENPACKDTDM